MKCAHCPPAPTMNPGEQRIMKKGKTRLTAHCRYSADMAHDSLAGKKLRYISLQLKNLRETNPSQGFPCSLRVPMIHNPAWELAIWNFSLMTSLTATKSTNSPPPRRMAKEWRNASAGKMYPASQSKKCNVKRHFLDCLLNEGLLLNLIAIAEM